MLCCIVSHIFFLSVIFTKFVCFLCRLPMLEIMRTMLFLRSLPYFFLLLIFCKVKYFSGLFMMLVAWWCSIILKPFLCHHNVFNHTLYSFNVKYCSHSLMVFVCGRNIFMLSTHHSTSILVKIIVFCHISKFWIFNYL